MKITKRQLRKLIREAIDVQNASTGEIMTFADEDDPGLGGFTPDAPELAAREIIKRLGLTPLEGYEDDPNDAVEQIWLSAEDWAEMDYEVGGKRHKRKAKKEAARLNIDNLMTRLEDWAVNAGEEYVADNPGTGLQDIAWDLAQGAEFSFEPDEWNVLLYTGQFESEDDLYTYIAELITQGSGLKESVGENYHTGFSVPEETYNRVLDIRRPDHQDHLFDLVDAYEAGDPDISLDILNKNIEDAEFEQRMTESTLSERRMETDVFRIVTRSLSRGPKTHQQLLANVLDAFPNTSDEEIDFHLDRLEDSGDIIFNPSMQKYQ